MLYTQQNVLIYRFNHKYISVGLTFTKKYQHRKEPKLLKIHR